VPDRYIDLHCHSTASDGRLTPTQLVEHARKLGLSALALTDHDTIAGIALFQTAGKKHGIETVACVEISADYAKGSMHMLGLFVDTQSQALRSFLKQLSEGRKVRNPQIVAKLNELGMALTMEEVEREAGIGQQYVGVAKNVGRPHIAAVLIKQGYVKTKQEAFDKYLAKGRAAYVTRFVASPRDSIDHIRNAGGLAILAHPPYLKTDSDAELEKVVAGLKADGLGGIEAYFSTHTPEQTAFYEKLAQKYDLAISGGTDFHGEAGRGGADIELGSGIKNMLKVKYEVLEKLKERRKK
jgi:predicted metal-dependent phosphoesterase TrpH